MKKKNQLDHIKSSAKIKWTLIQQIIDNEDLRMEFGKEKNASCLKRKRQIIKGIELPNLEKIRLLEQRENYKYVGILEADTIKQVEIKMKAYLR